MSTYVKAPDYADVMTKEEWLESIRCGAFIPDDGCGYWAKEIDGSILESGVDCFTEPPDDATHVAWYNK